ncbi:hypothetical protein [Vallitalea maricola]
MKKDGYLNTDKKRIINSTNTKAALDIFRLLRFLGNNSNNL